MWHEYIFHNTVKWTISFWIELINQQDNQDNSGSAMFPFSELAPVNELMYLISATLHTFYFTRLLFSLLLFFIFLLLFLSLWPTFTSIHIYWCIRKYVVSDLWHLSTINTVVSFVGRAKEDHANCEEPAELQEGLQRGGIPEGTQEPRLVVKRSHAHFHVCVTWSF